MKYSVALARAKEFANKQNVTVRIAKSKKVNTYKLSWSDENLSSCWVIVEEVEPKK